MDIGEVRLWKLTRRNAREGIDDGIIKGAIVPTGSTEQHNEHLAMIHDTASARLVSVRAAEKLYPNVIVTTPVPLGISEHWMDHKGTLTLKMETFFAVVYEVCESLQRAGIKSIFIVNGHAGNSGLADQVDGFSQKLGVDVKFCSYWEAYSQELVERLMESGNCPGHASEFETSFALAAFPDQVHWEGVDYDNAKLTISDSEKAKHDRALHQEAKLATAEKGEEMIAVAVEWVADTMRNMIQSQSE